MIELLGCVLKEYQLNLGCRLHFFREALRHQIPRLMNQTLYKETKKKVKWQKRAKLMLIRNFVYKKLQFQITLNEKIRKYFCAISAFLIEAAGVFTLHCLNFRLVLVFFSCTKATLKHEKHFSRADSSQLINESWKNVEKKFYITNGFFWN